MTKDKKQAIIDDIVAAGFDVVVAAALSKLIVDEQLEKILLEILLEGEPGLDPIGLLNDVDKKLTGNNWRASLEHRHRKHVEGCVRCDLSREESQETSKILRRRRIQP